MANNTSNSTSSYLVVLLSGPGQDLDPLVSNSYEPSDGYLHHRPPYMVKPCLPILNRPMIEFSLDWVEESGLNEVLILASESHRGPLTTVIRSRKSSAHSLLQIHLECIPDPQLRRDGTTGSLRWAIERNLIRTAFVLLPCDLYFNLLSPQPTFPQSFSPRPVTRSRSLLDLVERHRASQNLLTAVFYQRSPDLKDDSSLILTTLDPRTGTLLDTQELGADLTLRPSLLRHFPTPVLTSSLLPTHIYICSSVVLGLILYSSPGKMKSFKDEIVPWLAKAQWQTGLIRKRLIPGKNVTSPLDFLSTSYRRTTTEPSPRPLSPRPFVFPASATIPSTPLVAAQSPPTVPSTPLAATIPSTHSAVVRSPTAITLEVVAAGLYNEKKQSRKDAWRCEVVVWSSEDGFVGRANSVDGYAEANRAALKTFEEEAKRVAGKRPAAATGYGLDSCVGTGVVMGERCSVKKSVVGKGCRVGRGARVSNSILMERVTVGENAKIENCLVAEGAKIGDRAQLKDCEVGPGAVVADDTILKSERITHLDD